MDESQIFANVLKCAPAERTAYLDKACADRPELRAAVEALLNALDQHPDFLEKPASPLEATVDGPSFTDAPSNDEHGLERPGMTIGPYKLLEQIGEGGFGIVFMAEQTRPLKRKVALKVLKPGMDTRHVVARFEAERQALAIMDHPNIARVLDGGATPSGRPYFVMELVKGTPITEFCDQNHLPLRQRLELFLSVCQAVQHAHQKGIIHRDIKPSNVLVSRHDTTPMVKVIDFGIAKALGQTLTDRSLFTGFAQMLGTPLYMSPEQAGMSDLDVDTRSDLYSLGVLLYELLTGTTPLDRERFKKVAYDEIRRIIREEEPPPPSTRLSELSTDQASTPASTLASVAAMRQTEPTQLTRLVRGELDWIVMKALEKDRSRRYETANGFALDVQRYLADEPVLACPPSTTYRLRKFVRKHRVGIGFVASIVLLSLIGAAISAWQAHRAAQAETAALKERDEKEKAWEEEARQRDLAQRRHREAAWNLYVVRMATMSQASEAGNFTRMRRLLQESLPPDGDPDFRGWEWHLLKQHADRFLVELTGPDPYTGYADWSPISGHIAAATTSGSIDILDRDGKLQRSLRPDSGEICRLAWDPDGEKLAFLTPSHLNVWNSTTGKQLHVQKGRFDPTGAVAWSPDRKRLACAGADGNIVIYDSATFDVAHTLKTGWHGDYIPSLGWHPDGVRLASGHRGGRIIVWDVDRQAKLFIRQKGTIPIYAVAWNPEGSRLAVGRAPEIDLWDENGTQLLSLKGHGGTVVALRWTPDGRRMLSGSSDRTARIWNMETGQPVATLPCDERLRSVAWSADVQQILLGTDASRLMKSPSVEFSSIGGVYLVSRAGDRANLTAKLGASALTWNPGSARIAVIHRDAIEIMDGEHARTIRELKLPGLNHWMAASWSPDGRCLAGLDGRGAVAVWDAETGDKLAFRRTKYRGSNWDISWSPDGQWLALANSDPGIVEVWKTATWQCTASLNATIGSASLAWSPNSQLLAAGCTGGTGLIHVWSMTDLTKLYSTHATQGVKGLAFSKDGKTLIAGANVNLVYLRASDGVLFKVARGEHSIITSLARSHDGLRLATGCEDGTVRICDGGTGTVLLVLRCSSNPITSVNWSPDNRGLATTGDDGVLRLWTVP